MAKRKNKHNRKSSKKKSKKLQLVSNVNTSVAVLIGRRCSDTIVDGFTVLCREQLHDLKKRGRHSVLFNPDFRNSPSLKNYNSLEITVVGRTKDGDIGVFDAWEIFCEEELLYWTAMMRFSDKKHICICRTPDVEVRRYAYCDILSLVECGPIPDFATLITDHGNVLFLDAINDPINHSYSSACPTYDAYDALC